MSASNTLRPGTARSTENQPARAILSERSAIKVRTNRSYADVIP